MNTFYHNTAGGVLLDADNFVLVLERDVQRDGKTVHEVRLPKGHIERGETPLQAGIREVAEESGYRCLCIAGDLGTTHSTFEFQGSLHERDEHYYLMRLTAADPDAPQYTPGTEENLFCPAWFPIADAETLLTYGSEQEAVHRARTCLGI